MLLTPGGGACLRPAAQLTVEHTIAELKWWRVLQRFTGPCDLLPEIINAVAGLVSDKSAGLTW